jgi:hypothetical protein
MKNGKWMRFGLGLCILLSLLFLQGTTDHFSECALCFLDQNKDLGYLEIHNNTIYNIVVQGRIGPRPFGPYKITGSPNFMRIDLPNGAYQVAVFVCTPTPDQEPVYYKHYSVNVPPGYKTVSLTVTTPLSYIPIPK